MDLFESRGPFLIDFCSKKVLFPLKRVLSSPKRYFCILKKVPTDPYELSDETHYIYTIYWRYIFAFAPNSGQFHIYFYIYAPSSGQNPHIFAYICPYFGTVSNSIVPNSGYMCFWQQYWGHCYLFFLMKITNSTILLWNIGRIIEDVERKETQRPRHKLDSFASKINTVRLDYTGTMNPNRRCCMDFF